MSVHKNSVHSVQPFGRLLVTYLYTNVLFYYIDLIIFKGEVIYYSLAEGPGVARGEKKI